MKVEKRSGNLVDFNIMNIISVLYKASKSANIEIESSEVKKLANSIAKVFSDRDIVTYQEIQDAVENELIQKNHTKLAKAFIIGCYEKAFQRNASELDKSILSVISNENSEVSLENSNKDSSLVTTQRDYIAGEVSKNIAKRLIFGEDIIKYHDNGQIHIHDMDYAVQPLTNCGLVNLEDMFINGTMVGNVMIETPKSLRTASTVATQVVSSVASSQFGGQTISLAHLAPYVEVSREKYRKEVRGELELLEKQDEVELLDQLVEKRVLKEIKDSIQTINYQLNSMNTTNGQTPFVSIFIALCEAKNEREKHDLVLLATELFKQRIKGLKNKDGIYVTQTFPKLIYVLEEDNIHEDSPYWELTKLAAKCTAKRMVPDYMSAKKLMEIKKAIVPVMGCRSAINTDYSPHIYSKFNLGVVSLNLPHIALSSNGDPEEFWKILDERANILYKAQMIRVKRLRNTLVDVAPIIWKYGAYARLNSGDKLEKILDKEHCTISFGYMGLYEAVKYMTGKSHTDNGAMEFAKDILKKMNEYCQKWTKETNLGWGVYGTPAESLTYKFAKACLKDFGTVDGENKREYITNSYHVHVTEPIDAFTKLSIESEFQDLSTGGAISYIETPNLQDNIPAVLSVLQYIYDHIMYAELNCKSDYCYECGFDGEMGFYKSETDPNHFGWKCPECGNTDQSKLSVIRRTCGYLGENRNTAGWNKGRFMEINERVLHL